MATVIRRLPGSPHARRTPPSTGTMAAPRRRRLLAVRVIVIVAALALACGPRGADAFLAPHGPPHPNHHRPSSSSSSGRPLARMVLMSSGGGGGGGGYYEGLGDDGSKGSGSSGSSKAKPLDWLEEVRRKHYELRQLQESEEGYRLQAKLGRVSPEGGYRVARALKRSVGEPVHRMSVVAEIKRRTPTGGEAGPTEVAMIADVGLVARQLADCGADVLMVTTDGPCYGGSLQDLRAVAEAFRNVDEADRPAIVGKDLYIHPLQVAQAAEAGADGVLLMTCLLGASLQGMLDACSLLGIEALVEVHTVAELEKALELGATNIVATNWDRVENALYPDQAKGLKHMIPDLIVAVAAGGVATVKDAGELADMGYDAVVLGRGLANCPDIERLIHTVRTRESLPSLLTGAGYTAEEVKRQQQGKRRKKKSGNSDSSSGDAAEAGGIES